MSGQHLRVGTACNQVTRPAVEGTQRAQRLDYSLDAHSRAKQTEGQQGWPARTLQRNVRRDRRAMRDRGDFAAVYAEATAQPLAGRLGHHNHLIGQRRDRLKHRTLMWRRVFEDCVRDHDRWHTQTADDVDYFVSVDTAIDAVLMLDDGEVAPVQQLGTCR